MAGAGPFTMGVKDKVVTDKFEDTGESVPAIEDRLRVCA